MEPKSNLCAVLYGKDDIRLVNREHQENVLKPHKGEVLLAIQSVGICGSDVHFWSHGSIGDLKLVSPTVMGHESSAIVIGVGECVTNLKLGDRVAMEPGIPCYRCSYCKGGRYNLCPDVEFGSTPPFDGFFRNYKTHPADFCFKLPDHVSFDEGALLEPLSVGVYACRRGKIELGSRVLVCGAGPIGLVCLMAAKAYGATSITVIDIDAGRLETAKTCGASHIVKVEKTDNGKEIAKKIQHVVGYQLDQTIECTGAKSAISAGIYATRAGGCVVLVGLGEPEVSLPIVDASVREVDIYGVFRYVNCFPAALDLLSSGKIDVGPLITHRYKLSDVSTAFLTAKTGRDGAIKVIIDCANEN